jgi:FAD/FMN-containing dehydrogenase
MSDAAGLDEVDWAALGPGMEGDLILAGDDRMVLAGKHFAARLPLDPPRALLRCASVGDVRRALAFAADRRVPFAIRSGGHCFGDLSSSPGLVIDLAEMNRIEIGDGEVSCGPGTLSSDLSRALAAQGRVVPTGGCPLVAIGGLALAGGFGFLGRRYGLTANQVLRMEVLLADGRLVAASVEEEPDLFWALRGGGALGFGVVTELVLKTHALEPATLCNGKWPLAEAPRLIEAWQHWAPDAPGEVNLEIGLYSRDLPEIPAFVELFGIILGSPAEAAPHLAQLRSRLGPLAGGLRTWDLAAPAAADFLCGLLDHGANEAWLPSRPYAAAGFQATRSSFFDRPIGRAAIEAYVERFAAERCYGEHRELEFVPWGGAYRDGAGCFAHKDARLLVRHTVLAGARSDPAQRERATSWVEASAATLAASGNGAAYQGYAEPGRPDWPRICHGDAAAKLEALRARYDPAGLFAAVRLSLASGHLRRENGGRGKD